ncbi:unnamed protein product, partial [Arabidopsis halleri]
MLNKNFKYLIWLYSLQIFRVFIFIKADIRKYHKKIWIFEFPDMRKFS